LKLYIKNSFRSACVLWALHGLFIFFTLTVVSQNAESLFCFFYCIIHKICMYAFQRWALRMSVRLSMM
jgi:hypothetical protein